MKVEFSKRAAIDLHKIGVDSRAFGQAVAAAVEARIVRAIAHIAEHPEAGPRVEGRPGIRVLPLVRYPYRIFYRSSMAGSAFSTSVRPRVGRGSKDDSAVGRISAA